MNHSLRRPNRRTMLFVVAAAVSLATIPVVRQITENHASAVLAHRPATLVRPISCEKLADIPGKSVSTVIVDFPPGAFTPRHRHPGSVTAFVLKGTLRSQLAGGAAAIYTVGQTWFEPSGTIHLFAENASATEPAQLLATFIADDDCGSLTLMD